MAGSIFCINHNDQPYTAMRPIVENMGMAWGAQSEKLNSNKERWSVSIIETVAQDGVMRQSLCMPVRKLPAFLASINPRKVKPELRERIELYQNECDEVLWQYWTKGVAEQSARVQQTAIPSAMDDTPITVDQQCTLKTIMQEKVAHLSVEVQDALRRKMFVAMHQHFRITKYSQLPQSRLSEAIRFFMSYDLGVFSPEPSHIPAPPPMAITGRSRTDKSVTLLQRKAIVSKQKKEIAVRLDVLIGDIHSLLRDVCFSYDVSDDEKLSRLHRELFIMAESSMRSAQDAIRAGINMTQL